MSRQVVDLQVSVTTRFLYCTGRAWMRVTVLCYGYAHQTITTTVVVAAVVVMVIHRAAELFPWLLTDLAFG
jgi:hypothetical protein